MYTLAGFAFGRGLAEQDTLDDSGHFIASFVAVDALDEGFGAGRFSVVHKAPPGRSYATEPRRTKRDLSKRWAPGQTEYALPGSPYIHRLFAGYIAEVCAIRGRLRELVCRSVANGLLDLIGRFFPVSFVEHVGHSF